MTPFVDSERKNTTGRIIKATTDDRTCKFSHRMGLLHGNSFGYQLSKIKVKYDKIMVITITDKVLSTDTGIPLKPRPL